MWKVLDWDCLNNFNLLIYQQAVAILMWAPIQNLFYYFFHAFDERRTSRYQSWMPAMISLNVQPCKFQPCPGFYKLPTAVDGIRQESQSLESKMPPICQILHSSLYISYPSQFQRTQHILQNKSQVANPNHFPDWRNCGATWLFQNLALDGFDLVFGSTVLMQKCQWEVLTKWKTSAFHGGSICYCLDQQNSEHTVRSNEEGVWQVLRKWGQRDFVPLRSSWRDQFCLNPCKVAARRRRWALNKTRILYQIGNTWGVSMSVIRRW